MAIDENEEIYEFKYQEAKLTKCSRGRGGAKEESKEEDEKQMNSFSRHGGCIHS